MAQQLDYCLLLQRMQVRSLAPTWRLTTVTAAPEGPMASVSTEVMCTNPPHHQYKRKIHIFKEWTQAMKHYSTMNRSKTTKDRHCAECETQTQDFTQHRQGNPKDRRGLWVLGTGERI